MKLSWNKALKTDYQLNWYEPSPEVQNGIWGIQTNQPVHAPKLPFLCAIAFLDKWLKLFDVEGQQQPCLNNNNNK